MVEIVGPNKSIVVIEDEETLAHLLEFKLRAAGFSVEIARDGQKGVDLIRGAVPDLVLLDMLSPVMDGFQVIETLTQEHILPALPIIIISNSGQPVEIDRAIKMGVRGYLIKANITPDEIIKKVTDFFARERDPLLPADAETEKKLKLSILIVEDDTILSGLLEQKAEQENFQVFKAMHVEEARKILNEQTVDVILLDVVLPDIDGFMYLQELKADSARAHIPVIIISNLGQREEKEKGFLFGAIDYVVKSDVLPGDILKKVRDVVKKK